MDNSVPGYSLLTGWEDTPDRDSIPDDQTSLPIDGTSPGGDSIVGPGGEDLRPGVDDPGQSTGGGGEPGRDTTVVGPGGEDLETSTAVLKDGKYYDSTGRLLYDPKSADTGGIMGLINKYLGKDVADKVKNLFMDKEGNVNLGTLGAIAGGIYGLMGGNQIETGIYKGKIPKYSAVRQQVDQPEYEPYSGKPVMGRSYFTDTQFVKDPTPESIDLAKKTAQEQADALAKYQPKIKEQKTTGIATLPESKKGILPDPNELIAKERGIVAAKNAPPKNINADMAEIMRLNPQLDWSKYNPNKMTMDVDDYTRAINNYYTSKGFTLPSRDQRLKNLEEIAGKGNMPPPPGGGKIVPAESEYGYPKSEDRKWYYADGKWLPNEEIFLDPTEWNGSFGNTPEDFGYKEIPKSAYGTNNPDLWKPEEIKQPEPQLSDAINLLKTGGSKDDAVNILKSIVGLDKPATTTVAEPSKDVYWNPTRNTLSSQPPTGVASLMGPTTAPAVTEPVLLQDSLAKEGASQMAGTPTTVGRPFRRFVNFDHGGIATLAKGRYLRGGTDGMADMIPSSIDDKQPAKLSHGEFVIPADVVSHLGNGNSDAGADVLYKMMDKVRKARTGTKEQGKRINPEKFTPGGIAGYRNGGVVAFEAGGTTGTTNVGGAPTGSTTTTGLADWAGDAVTDYIARGQALAAKPLEVYKGPLTAGTSDLQTQAFNAAKGLGGGFDAAAASQYMNPYIQNALQPQLNELRRQADISQQSLSGKYAQAGALGGARDAISRSEGIRNLLSQQSGVIGGAYKDAYDKAMQQYNTSKSQNIADINAMLTAGAAQRGIEQEGVTANKAAFEEQRQDPYARLKFEQSLFTGLPLSASATTPNLSPLQQLGLTGDQMTKFYDLINNFINPKPAATSSTGTTATTSAGTTGAKTGP